MTHKPPITSKSVPVHQPTKLNAATLRNMAHQLESSGVVPHDDDALQRIAEMLAKLSLSNVDLVTSIIQVIVDQQTPAK